MADMVATDPETTAMRRNSIHQGDRVIQACDWTALDPKCHAPQVITQGLWGAAWADAPDLSGASLTPVTTPLREQNGQELMILGGRSVN